MRHEGPSAALPGGVLSSDQAYIVAGASGTGGSFSVTGVAAGAAQITASAPGYNSATVTVTVTNSVISLTPGLTVGPGATASLPVMISATTANPLPITLTSVDPTLIAVSNATIPASKNNSSDRPKPRSTSHRH